MSRKKIKKPIRIAVQLVSVAVLIFLDLFIKKIVTDRLAPIGSVTVINNFFEFNYTRNSGAAWGMMGNKSELLSFLVGIVLIAMIVSLFFIKEKNPVWHICIPLIIAGGAANLADRLLNGYVTDYLRVTFIDFPVFNLADCFIVVGCISLIIYLICDIISESRANKGKISEGNTDEKI